VIVRVEKSLFERCAQYIDKLDHQRGLSIMITVPLPEAWGSGSGRGLILGAITVIFGRTSK
jgi:hypothetical protein